MSGDVVWFPFADEDEWIEECLSTHHLRADELQECELKQLVDAEGRVYLFLIYKGRVIGTKAYHSE